LVKGQFNIPVLKGLTLCSLQVTMDFLLQGHWVKPFTLIFYFSCVHITSWQYMFVIMPSIMLLFCWHCSLDNHTNVKVKSSMYCTKICSEILCTN